MSTFLVPGRRKRSPLTGLMLTCAMVGLCTGPLVGGATLASAAGSAPLAVQTVSPASGNDSCAKLSGFKAANVEIVSASLEGGLTPITSLKTFFGSPVGQVPAFCRVTAQLHPTSGSDIGIEVWMPTDGWNGRFHGVGVGGFAGTFDYDSLASAVRGGQVGFGSDMGHKGKGEGTAPLIDASWAKGHPEKIRDYGSRAVHVGTVTAKQIVKAFYGRDVEHAYFVGCSGGGRQGLMEAALYPEDYDGVMAGAPAASWTGLAMAMTNAAQAQMAPGAGLLASQMAFLQTEVLRQCDKIDGQLDGLILDPRKCKLRTIELSCDRNSTAGCFSKAQIGTLDRIYAGPRTRSGNLVFPTYLPAGTEDGMLSWPAYITVDGQGTSGAEKHADGLYRNLVAKPFATAATFDFDEDPARLRAALSKELDAPTDLTRFFDRGGKLIMWHGWGDPAIAPDASLNYIAEVRRRSGGNAVAATQFFMVPGLQHCAGGTGINSFGQIGAPLSTDLPKNNVVSALQQWVEKGEKPRELVGTFGGMNYYGGRSENSRKRMICAWPMQSRLEPGADPDKAESYRCSSVS